MPINVKRLKPGYRPAYPVQPRPRGEPAQALLKYETLAYRLMISRYDWFHGCEGHVRCAPFHEIQGYNERIGIHVTSDKGGQRIFMWALPSERLSDFWLRFVKQIKPLRRRSMFAAFIKEHDLGRYREEAGRRFAGNVRNPPCWAFQLMAINSSGRSMVDTTIHKNYPTEGDHQRFTKVCSAAGFSVSRVVVQDFVLKD